MLRISIHFHHCLSMKRLSDNDCTGIGMMETKAAAERSNDPPKLLE